MPDHSDEQHDHHQVPTAVGDDWLYTEDQLISTPSVEDGVSSEDEWELRKEGIDYLMETAKSLNMRLPSAATAAIFFHRFYMNQSFNEFNGLDVARSSLFLASKSEDRNRLKTNHQNHKIRLKDVIRASYYSLQGTKIDESSREFEEWVDRLLLHERLILPSIGFDLGVDLHHKYLRILNVQEHTEIFKTSIYLANSILGSKVVLKYPAPLVACAVISHALKCAKQRTLKKVTKDDQPWWTAFLQFGVDFDAEKLETVRKEIHTFVKQAREDAKKRTVAAAPAGNKDAKRETNL